MAGWFERVMVWLSDLASSQTAWEEKTTGNEAYTDVPPSLPLSLPLSIHSSIPTSLPFLPLSFFSFTFPFPLSISSPILDIQGNLRQPGMVLEGQVDRGRFGNSVTNLGDIDDDGYEGMHVCRIW